MLGMGVNLGSLSRKVYLNALTQNEFCVCDNVFEFMVGFTNGIIPEIDARNLLHSLQNKSKNFMASIAPVFDAKTDTTKAEAVSKQVSAFALKTQYLYHIMTADGAFVKEATAVYPTLQCMQKISTTVSASAIADFNTAKADYNGEHWYFAGEYMAAVAVDICGAQQMEREGLFLW
eukprot:NODE_1950_length_1027_cov_82.921268_g1583_i0.p2 GENE.NODE_1950_length_1027_cov_82.921268_g1583_i0~~NODE_1950_length_1027_cov_82.921268_g1583_i0.p2  ORF type:complete len:176 (-),score=55.20 NODE_1950_length_1027_cov_82.921268_g1583_i0:27-554(-)